ncbi:unnamed protein product [Penicillium salamii]|uniref:UBC core domain-containing protein n=1 Tax=Penicillium salamii TaxID=1612424 RepID=A0A9W4IA72_9EURO|nr:unnamed protein product [Penicillium salamii]CAG8250278.1 unnamed protein product [Penicillium salamii]CAG8267807.1 unnamed protein product [Penicillium salamii]CAG8340055.1 unnamed protein product [Penicillium salamii]CAG8369161.1 unnamed protein product [Penicillium salamii]
MAERILMNEYKSLQKERWVHVAVSQPPIVNGVNRFRHILHLVINDLTEMQLHNDDIFQWDIALIVVNPDSMYYGGYFKAVMRFPSNYPYVPPKFQFLKPLHHPNIYPDGKLCISILHAPGDDEMSGELASERWSPAQRVESVLISILSLLDDAECSSPANVDAAVLLRNEPEVYRRLVKADVEKSRLDIPEGFEMPTHAAMASEPMEKEDHDFWADSDVDSDVFGGSDSDDNLDMEESSGEDMEDESADDSSDTEETPRKPRANE